MKITLSMLIIFATLASFKGFSQQKNNNGYPHHLLPVPASVEWQNGRLVLSESFTYAIKGYSDERLQKGIERAMRRLEGRTGLVFKRGATSDTARFIVECESAGDAVQSVNEDEAYQLDIDGQHADLKARTVVGVLRGLETLLQLLEADRSGYYFVAAKIQDRPRFAWRGLMIDVCRHWEPVEVIKRNLDGMAAMKLNVFHWHLSEDQGFRVEVEKYPKLHEMGSDGLYYTQEQVREVVAYARDRGIRVVPEFDMPGHVSSWLVGYPELAAIDDQYEIERHFGVFDAVFDPTRNRVYKFLDNFFKEMVKLFPDAYMHIGGDENNGVDWTKNEKIVAFRKSKNLADNHALQAYFNQRLLKILTKHKKKMVGWDEILHQDLPKDIVVQSWRGKKSLADGARQGFMGILSNGYYLDHIRTAEFHYLNDPIDAQSGLSAEEAGRVLGGEACMWSEHVNADTIDSRIWTRLPAIAERLWSPREVKDVPDMYRRLEIVSSQLEELGLLHEKNVTMLMRRLTNGRDSEALQRLVEVIEPVDFGTRARTGPRTTQETPLTRIVDAARPDPVSRRHFAAMIDELLADKPRLAANRERLMQTFMGWRDNRAPFQAIAEVSPILQEAEALANDLSDVGAMGMEAMIYLLSGTVPPTDWQAAKLARLDEAAKPKAKVKLVVIPAMKRLIAAAAEGKK